MTTLPLKNVRVARVATTTFSTTTQLLPQLEAIHHAGAQVTVVASDDAWSEPLSHLDYCQFTPIPIQREIHLFADCLSLFRLWRFFVVNRFDIVHSISPKAGLLTAIAGKLAGIPIRLHTFTGQPWVSKRGIMRSIIKWCDRMIVRLNTCCYADSFSQRDFLIEQRIANIDQIKVLGHGSLAGIDLQRFSAQKYSIDQKTALRQSLGLKKNTPVILFLGRVTEDKGIYELLQAFSQILHQRADCVLLIVGSFEKKIEEQIRAQAHSLCGDKVFFTGFTSVPEQYIAIADLLCLPSYREGFGTVVIEAAAMGIPTIGSRIYGLSDAIVDGETGLLVAPKNVDQLKEAIIQLLENSALRKQLGDQAKSRAIQAFDSRYCGELIVNEYIEMIKKTP